MKVQHQEQEGQQGVAARPHQRSVREAGAEEGYRARAAYKLKEIDETLGLIKPGQLVVDLGAAPGAWSQYVRRRFAPRRRGGARPAR